MYICFHCSKTGSGQSHLRDVREWLTAVLMPDAAMDDPDPTLSIDGGKLALNPSMHAAVPKACQLAETKPFVGADGEMDSK